MLRKSSKKVISFVLCVCLVIGIFPFTMFFNAQEPELPNHLIINQAAGVGNNADGALSHSFVEIYNPTDALVDLSGYSLQYAENGNVWKVLNLTGSVPAKHSYLVRANGSVTSENARYTIYYADQNWGIVISNDSFKIALVGHQENLTVNNPGKSDGVIDLIGAYNSPASVDYGEGLNPIGGASKQRSVRRINFQDTDDNAADFESLHYGNISLEKIAEVRPCSLRDGEWDAEIRPEMPVPPVSGTISFSEPAGIYKNEFYLTLETALQEAVIRYTLDGEDPTAESSEYSAQLRIYDRTSEDEVMVQRTGTTGPLAFNGSYVRPPLGTVYKGTVVKAQLFTEDGEAVSPVYVNSYFVNPDMAAKYGGIPIISISVPSDYFFDTNFGIYQRGPFDSYANYIYPDYRTWRSYGDPIVYNFDQRGFEWERPAYVEMFDPASGSDWEQNSVISQGIGVRINGGNSRHSAQKALRFYTRTGDIVSNDGRSLPVHNGKSFLDYDFFQGTAKDDAGNPITGGFKRLLLRASGNDINNAFMRHSLVNVISAGLAADTQAYRPVVVFLNGEFWGFYEMIERFDDEYLVQHYGGSNNNYDILENPSALHIGPEQATPDSIAYFNSVVNKIEQAVDTYGISSPEVYAEVLKYVDEASLIDINILETFFGNADWVNKINEGKGRYGNNQQIWRYTGTPTNKPGQDGKYRWMLVDMDHSFDLSYGGGDLSGLSYAPWADTITYAIYGDDFVTIQASTISGADAAKNNNYFFYILMQNDDFKSKFVNRYMDLLNTNLSNSAMNDVLNGIVAGMDKLWQGEQKHRWSYTADYNQWLGMVGSIRNSMQQRTDKASGIIDNSLIKYVDGTKELTGLTLNNQGNNGYMKLNGMSLTDSNWTGKYFVGYEQTIEATAKSGYTFVCFDVVENTSGASVKSTSPVLALEMISGGYTVTAIYVERSGISDPAPLIINQAAGVNAAADGAISHSFVEIYNPTDDPVSLEGWSLQYTPNGAGWTKLDFPDDAVIPAHHSYLVRMQKTVPNHSNNYLIIDEYDLEWEGFVHNNDTFKYALVAHQEIMTIYNPTTDDGVVDFVSANNPPSNPSPGWGADFWWGSGPVGKFSKQQSVRRVDFVNTFDNAKDFESVDYRTVNGMTKEKLEQDRPRSLADGAWPVQNPKQASLIINQVYGSGPLDNTGAISHGFIELYNPTNVAISLDGWSLQLQNGKDASNAATEWEKLNFSSTHVVAPNGYFLIRLAEAAPTNARCILTKSDIDWTDGRTLSNRAYSVALVNNQTLLSKVITTSEMEGVVDLVGALNDGRNDDPLNFETEPYGGMSKQKSVRRINFNDTDNNAVDFEDLDYRGSGISDEVLNLKGPRYSGGLAFGDELPPDEGDLFDHLIINQVFGGGPNDNTGSVSHSFVEIYNPTDTDINLSGWSLQVQNGNENSGTPATEWERFDFDNTHVVKSYTSFLIRLDEVAQNNAKLTIDDYDVSWISGRLLSNRAYSVALVRNQTTLTKYITPEEMDDVVDLVGAKNTGANDLVLNFEIAPFNDISKQKSARRISFQDTDNNLADFESVGYNNATQDVIDQKHPRWSGDGTWGMGEPPKPPDEGYLPDHLIINQAAGIGDVAADSNPGAIQYSFVELYNPTNETVDISGWSLQYAESGDSWAKIDLVGSILAKRSYLVRMNGVSQNARLLIPTADLYWDDIIISNRSYKFALVNHQNLLTVYNPTAAQGVVDLVGADNPQDFADFWEGSGAVGKMSKQQAVRRQNFADYDENWYDFESADYRLTGVAGQNIEKYRPRTSGDGPWGEDLIPPPPPPSTTGTIEFNKPAGIYSDPFNLTLSTATSGATIRYTIDGEDPTINSPEYNSNEPLRIDDRTADYPELAWKTGTTGPRNEIDAYDRNAMEPVFKGTVVKARLFNASGQPISDIYVNSYFVNDNIYNLYGEMPIISVSTPVDNLFGDQGIYVKGPNEPYGPFNFDQKGSEWERPVYFEMFDPAYGSGWETSAVISQGLGLRIHGGASRHFPQKSLRFYARSGQLTTNMGVLPVINGKNSVDYDIFDGNAGVTGNFKRFMLRSAGNDAAKSFIRDSVSSLLTSDIATVDTQGYRPAVLFINGEFWGLYQVLERFDDEYLAQHYGGTSGDYRILENPSPGKTSPEDNDPDAILYYEGKVSIVDAIADMNTPEAYAKLLEIVDEDSLIDYVIIETLGGNLDWVGFSGEWESEFGHFIYNGNNQRMWYYCGAPDGLPGHDGRFRWMLYDTDKSWGYTHGGEYNDPNYNTIEDALCDNLFFFNKLWQNDVFRAKFIERYLEALKTWLALDVMQDTVDAVAGEIKLAIVEQKKRWPYTPSYEDWSNEVESIKTWMAQRVDPNGAFIRALNSYMPDSQTLYAAAYVGEPDSLPAGITWSNLNVFTNAKAFDTISLIGTINTSGVIVTAIVEVIPRDLVYFIDAGTAQLYNKDNNPVYPGTAWRDENGEQHFGNMENFLTSVSYSLIADRLALNGRYLRNGVSDQLFDGTWGLIPDAYQFPVVHLNQLNSKLVSGYVGWDDRDEEGYEDRNKYVEYSLYLPAGEYEITTGHYCWWDLMYDSQGEPSGGFARTMQVLFNDIPVCEPFTFNNLGDNKVVTSNYTQTEDGYLRIKVPALEGGDGSTLSFIGVEFVGEDNVIGTIDIYTAAYVGEPDSLPATVNVLYASGKTSPAPVTWNTTLFTSAKEYDTVQLTGTVTGTDLTVTATIEVIPYNLVYFIDAAAFAGADKTPSWMDVPARCFVEPHDCEYPDVKVDNWVQGVYTSPAYDAVSAKLAARGASLRNNAPDKLYDGTNTGWGVNRNSYQFTAEMINMPLEHKFVSGYVGYDNNEDYINEIKYIEYTLYLPRGEYLITTGHYDWWGEHGGHPRAMNILFNDELVGDTIYFGKFMQSEIVMNTYVQNNSGLLTIKVEAIDEGLFKDGAALTFIGVEFVCEPDGEIHTVTFVPDNGEASVPVQVYHGEKVPEPAEPELIGYDFSGWYEDDAIEPFDFDTPIMGDITLKAKWEEIQDVPIEIFGGDPIYVAAYVGEADSLPATVKVLYASGITRSAAVIWNNTAPFMSAEEYDTVQLTGTVTGTDLTVTAIVEVIPRDLVYFIDAGTIGVYPDNGGWLGSNTLHVVEVSGDDISYEPHPGPEGSNAYDSIKAKLAEDSLSLLNDKSDKFYDGTWGLSDDAYQFPVTYLEPLNQKLSTGYVGWDLRPWDPEYDGKNTYIEYKMYLPEGGYLITTGHYCWWNRTESEDGEGGGFPREMAVQFNDVTAGKLVDFDKFGMNKVVTYPHVQEENGELVIRVYTTEGDGAVLSFIGIQKDDEVTIITHEVTFVDWDGTELEKQIVRHEAPATAPNHPDSRQGYVPDGWDVDFKSVTRNLIVTAQYVIDRIIAVRGNTHWIIAAYVGEPETISLPENVDVEYLNGNNGTAGVTWETAPFMSAKEYDTVQLTGTVTGTDLTVTATIEVIPRNLRYYIDAGTAGLPGTMYMEEINGGIEYLSDISIAGSDAYDAVKALLEKEEDIPLYNGTSDQLFNGDWGIIEDTYQFPVYLLNRPDDQKIATGYVGWDDWEEYTDENKYIEYRIYLPKGVYNITTGHYCWWDPQFEGGLQVGGFARTMQISFNGSPQGDPFRFDGFGQNSVCTYAYTQAEDGFLSLRIEHVEGDGPTLSFIGVEFVREPDKFYTVTFVDYDGTEVETDTVADGSAATAPPHPDSRQSEGYDPDGWAPAFDNITDDLTVTAQYKIKVLTVTFVEGDEEPLLELVDYGDTVDEPEPSIFKDYTFLGWFEEDATEPFDFETPITRNITLIAKWEKINTTSVKVTGRIRSYNAKNMTTVELWQDGELKRSTEIPAEEIGGSRVDQNFTIEGVEPGTYTLVITKAAHTKFTVMNIVVGDSDVDLTEDSREAVQLMTLVAGDADCDGFVNFGDLFMVMNNIDTTAEEATANGVPYADIDGDGFVNFGDMFIIMNNIDKGAVVIP